MKVNKPRDSFNCILEVRVQRMLAVFGQLSLAVRARHEVVLCCLDAIMPRASKQSAFFAKLHYASSQCQWS